MANVSKLYMKQTVSNALTLSVITKLGVEILKRSNNADLKLSGQGLSDEAVSVMLMTNLDNELSKIEEN